MWNVLNFNSKDCVLNIPNSKMCQDAPEHNSDDKGSILLFANKRLCQWATEHESCSFDDRYFNFLIICRCDEKNIKNAKHFVKAYKKWINELLEKALY